MKIEHFWACTSAGACVAGFIEWSIPYLQFIALMISIAAGLRAWIAGRRKRH
jgi:hypothetical protein